MAAYLSGEFNSQFFTDSGALAAGYRLYTYDPGTTTHRNVYTEDTGTTPHTYTSDGIGGQYIALNARGELPAPMFFTAGGCDVVLKTAAGVTVWTRRAYGTDPSAGVAGLEAELAGASTAITGAGMIGFDAAVAYGEDTIGLGLKRMGVTPKMFGAVGDNSTDDTAALQNWAASAFHHAMDPGATYKLTGSLSLPKVIEGRGASIICTSTGIITCAGALTQIADLSVSPGEGDQTLTFGSAHSLSQDDVIVIYNPTNSSFNSARTYYRAGEFCRVATVPGTTTIDLTEPLKAGYTAANVDVYKMTETEVVWCDFTISGPDATVPAVKLSLATRAVLRNVRISFASYLGIYIDRCFDYALIDCHTNVPKTAISDCYGLLHGNSQNGKVIGGVYYSLRNSIDHGGDDLTGCVPVRNITHLGVTITNDNGVSAEAANSHANAVGIRFEACTIMGGASLNGREIEYVDCNIGGAPAGLGYLVGGGSEMIGGRYSVSNCKLKAGGAYAVGLVRSYNGANTTADTHLIVEDNDVDMGSCDTYVRCDLITSTYKTNARVDGVVFTDGAASLVNICRMVGTGAGGDGDYVIVDRVTNAPSGAILYFAASSYGSTVKCRLQEQRGSTTITPVSGAALANSASQTFRYSYGSKTPQCSVDLASGTVNSKTVIGYPSSVSATAIIATMRTCDSTTMGVTSPDVTAYWTASVNEI